MQVSLGVLTGREGIQTFEMISSYLKWQPEAAGLIIWNETEGNGPHVEAINPIKDHLLSGVQYT